MKRLILIACAVALSGCNPHHPNYVHIKESGDSFGGVAVDAERDAVHTKSIVTAADRRSRWPRTEAEVAFGVECARIRCLEPAHPVPGVVVPEQP